MIGRVVPEPTYRRLVKAGSSFSREVNGRIYQLGRVVDAVARAYHADRAAMRRVFEAPSLLDGRSSLAVATASAAGADVAVAVVESAAAGYPLSHGDPSPAGQAQARLPHPEPSGPVSDLGRGRGAAQAKPLALRWAYSDLRQRVLFDGRNEKARA